MNQTQVIAVIAAILRVGNPALNDTQAVEHAVALLSVAGTKTKP